MDKWPDSHLSIASTLPNGKSYYSGLSLHDPAMLVSSDGGSTWTLATTQTFVQGMDQLP